MTYLWDTTTCSALMRRDAKVRARVAALTPADRVVICTITRREILYGLARLPEGKRRSALEAEAMSLFGQVVCLAVPEAAADQYAAIKWETERQGTPLDENDLWIAATARTLAAVVVTTDVISSGSAACSQRIGHNDTDLAGPSFRSASTTWGCHGSLGA